MPDGAYIFEQDKPHFHRAPAPAELGQLLDTLIARITRTLVPGDVRVEEAQQPYLDLELNSPLEQLRAAAVRYRIAVGAVAGRKTMTLHSRGAMVDDTTQSKPFTAVRDGLSRPRKSRARSRPHRASANNSSTSRVRPIPTIPDQIPTVAHTHQPSASLWLDYHSALRVYYRHRLGR